jgi:hypothetical protein
LIDLISTYGKKPTDSKADLISLHSLTNETRDKMKIDNVDTDNDTNITIISSTIHDSNNINNTMMTPEEAEILNTKEDALIKNNEISAYKIILKIDKGVIGKDAIDILKQNLQEKESMYDRIKVLKLKCLMR